MTAVRTDTAAAARAGAYTSTALWEKIRYHPARFIFVVYVLFLLANVVAGFLYRDQFGFIDERNISLLFRMIPVLGFISLGVGMLMIAGEFDLSVGGVCMSSRPTWRAPYFTKVSGRLGLRSWLGLWRH